MQTIKIRSRVGDDGILNLQVPVGTKNQKLDVLIVVQPVTDDPDENGWSPDFFGAIVGGWQGNKLIRPPQGEFENRQDFQ